MEVNPQLRNNGKWRLRHGERRAILIVGDFLLSITSIMVGIFVWYQILNEPLTMGTFLLERIPAWFYFLPIVWPILLVETYDLRIINNFPKSLRLVVFSAFLALFLYFGLYFALTNTLPRIGIAVFLFSATGLSIIWRFLFTRIFVSSHFLHRAIIVGAGESGRALMSAVNELSPPPFHLVGFLDDDISFENTLVDSYPVLGRSDSLISIIKQKNITNIIVSISGEVFPETLAQLTAAQELGIQISRMARVYEEHTGRVPIQYLEADWIIRSFIDEARKPKINDLIKRFIDIVGALIGVAIFIVIGPLIALAIFIEDGRPIVFQQTRSGKNGKPFTILKFRSMKNDAEASGTPQLAQEKDHRATKVGRVLRKTHLDEWLQFFNVLKGEMSIVGPRPERPSLMEEFEKKIPFFRARLMVKPGIAGWAQIHVSYFATLEEMAAKLEYDLYYIKHRGMWVDFVILLRTIGAVIGFRGR
jgi:exopolysaccharide biosynthesis polyprenyl glycosylphosphotransferase